MKKITKIAVAAGLTTAALALSPAQAHADTIGEVAHQVCASLYTNPTVDNFDVIVADLLVLYTEESEEQSMYYAMHTACPEFLPLAVAAVQQGLASAPPATEPFNGKRMV